MAMPVLKAKNTTREFIDVFNGYVHKMKIKDGEFYETKNLTTAKYPLFATRNRRGTKQWTTPAAYDATKTYPLGSYVTYSDKMYRCTTAITTAEAWTAAHWTEVTKMFQNLQAIIAKDQLYFVDGGILYANGVPTALTGLQTTDPTQLVSMGAYICVFPDKKYINTLDLTDYGNMGASVNVTGSVTYSMCHQDGTIYTTVESGGSEPENPQNGDVWVDTTTDTAQEYSSASGSWITLETVYTRIDFPSMGVIPAAFKEYDGVEIEGAYYEDLNGSKIIYAIGGSSESNDYIVVVGIQGEALTVSDSNITVKREVPNMDYVCSANNRLWGCYYGNTAQGNVNEIYCCALGDFRNWSQYLGISTDSWRASCGSDGVWTGCINYLGTPTFFKENIIHPVAISSSGAHQVSDIPARGVQNGSWKSLAVVNETLYYKSRTGIMAYQGGMPADIADPLAGEKYYNAVAGVFGQNYYISMKDAHDVWQFFCYDAARGLWMHEDQLHAEGFAAVGDELYVLSENNIIALNGTEGTLESPVSWMAETGILPYRYPDKKYVYRYDFSLTMEMNASMQLYIEYDSNNIWTFMGDVVMDSTPETTGSKTIPVRPRRCDHLRIKLVGKGDVRILSITRILEKGSDV